jgi:hypothetical protein
MNDEGCSRILCLGIVGMPKELPNITLNICVFLGMDVSQKVHGLALAR